MRIYEAYESAGSIHIRKNGELKRFAVRVMDLPLWDEYQRLVSEYQRFAGEQGSGDMVQDYERGAEAVRLIRRQLSLLCPDITDDDLHGIPLSGVKDIVQDAAKQAMAFEQSVDVDTKKKQHDGPTASSSSPAEVSHSQPSSETEGSDHMNSNRSYEPPRH